MRNPSSVELLPEGANLFAEARCDSLDLSPSRLVSFQPTSVTIQHISDLAGDVGHVYNVRHAYGYRGPCPSGQRLGHISH